MVYLSNGLVGCRRPDLFLLSRNMKVAMDTRARSGWKRRVSIWIMVVLRCWVLNLKNSIYVGSTWCLLKFFLMEDRTWSWVFLVLYWCRKWRVSIVYKKTSPLKPFPRASMSLLEILRLLSKFFPIFFVLILIGIEKINI